MYANKYKVALQILLLFEINSFDKLLQKISKLLQKYALNENHDIFKYIHKDLANWFL